MHIRAPLWPETLKALSEAIQTRPRAKDPADAGLCFLTRQGRRWVRFGANGTSVVDLISDAFSKLLKKLDLKREGLGFYALRHTFETIAGGCGDQTAVPSIMGHVDNSMSALYRETIDDERLLKAVNHVHAWKLRVCAWDFVHGGRKEELHSLRQSDPMNRVCLLTRCNQVSPAENHLAIRICPSPLR